MSVSLFSISGAVRKNPTMNPVSIPDGPFIFSNQPGSGSECVHPTIYETRINVYLHYLTFIN